MTILRSSRVVTPAGEIDGWVRISDGRIAEVRAGSPAGDAVELGGPLVAGFVDIHNHGGAGGWVTSGNPGLIRAALDMHRARGSTSIMVSLMTASPEELERQLDEVAAVATTAEYADRVLGVHLEGPFLSPERAGAQPREHLALPTGELIARLVDRIPRLVRMVTLAPELDGADRALRELRDRGIVVAVGHTTATWETATAAFDAGATVATHLFNGMPPLQSRAPGPAGAALTHPHVVCELVIDGVHVHEGNVRLTLAAARGRIALITDAAAVAGMPPGSYHVAPRDLDVRSGAAFERESGDLVGSIMTAADAFARAVLIYGMTLTEASAAASLTPAKVVGLVDRGAIEPGMVADLVVLDDDLSVQAVLARGQIVAGRIAAPTPGP